MARPLILITALLALGFMAGCFSPMYIHENEFLGKSAEQQEAISEALQGALYRLRARPRDKDKEEDVARQEPLENLVKGKKVAVNIAMIDRGLSQMDRSPDCDYIRTYLKSYLIQHMAADVRDEKDAEYVIMVMVRAFGVNVELTSFPISYLPIYTNLKVEAVVRLRVFMYHRETNMPIFFKEVGEKKDYSKNTLFGFSF